MTQATKANKPLRKPKWLIRNLPTEPTYEEVCRVIGKGLLNTVCQEAKCPNHFECFSKKTATFLILGKQCTRNCRFCSIEYGPCELPDPDEPRRVAEAAENLGLRYVVVTSVSRDDLPDGGARMFSETIRGIRKKIPGARVEVLIPDFNGDDKALMTVLDARPDVLNHNIETVPRLYCSVRPQASYERSLKLLKMVKSFTPNTPTKSGLMLGLGEQSGEIREVLEDLYSVGCRIVTIGQYLQPSKHHLPVERYITPDEFTTWRSVALKIGFQGVASGPFIRSSYHAEALYPRNSSLPHN